MRAKKSLSLEKNIESIDFSFDPLLFDSGNFNHSEFLQKEGARSLLKGDIKGLEYFDLATDLDKDNPKLYYEQGVCLFEYGSEQKKKKYLLLANKKFKLAAKLQPESASVWHAWGNTLSFLGEVFEEHHFLRAAKEKFQKAMSLVSESDEIFGKIHQDAAELFKKMATYSGEVSDLQEALSSFKMASKKEESLSPDFWHEYAHTTYLLALQLGDNRFLLQAISLYKEALRQNPSSESIWTDLAKALSYLYEITHDEDHFCQANECFASSAKLNPQDATLWHSWALLFKKSGERLKDGKRLHASVEKCQRALSIHKKYEAAIVTLTEGLSSLGTLMDRLDFIYDAHNRALAAIDKYGPSPDLCKGLGLSLFALGEYYNDLDYYYQAIEKFQEGLSINRVHHELWYHLGHTYSIAAELEGDIQIYERAARFFAKAIHLHASSTYYFEYAVAVAKMAIHRQDEQNLELAILHFEQAFALEKNVSFLNPSWLFHYAMTLDAMGDLLEEETYYEKAIEILARVLLLDPDYPDIHFRIGAIYTHLGEMIQMEEPFLRAIQHFKLSYQHDEENDAVMLEWGLTLMNLSELKYDDEEKMPLFEEAEFKLMQSARLGNAHAYYHLACLFSMQNQFDKSFFFLKKADEYEGMPPLDDILEDLWLEGLRTTESFRHFINQFERPEETSEK